MAFDSSIFIFFFFPLQFHPSHRHSSLVGFWYCVLFVCFLMNNFLMSSAAFVAGFWEALLTRCLWMKPSVLCRNNKWFCTRKSSIHCGCQEEMKNCMTIVCKKPAFPMRGRKAACRRLAHIGSLLDYDKFMYGENALWKEIFTDHNKCEYIIQSGVSHN